jgi:hypothetical protein
MMKFAKMLAHAVMPKVETGMPGFTIYAGETIGKSGQGGVEWGEVKGVRTCILADIPEGMVGHLVAYPGRLINVAGGTLVSGRGDELIVPLANPHRNAYPVHAGDPIALLVLHEESVDLEVEEAPLRELQKEIRERVDEKKTSALKEQKKPAKPSASQKPTGGPGGNPTSNPEGK